MVQTHYGMILKQTKYHTTHEVCTCLKQHVSQMQRSCEEFDCTWALLGVETPTADLDTSSGVPGPELVKGRQDSQVPRIGCPNLFTLLGPAPQC